MDELEARILARRFLSALGPLLTVDLDRYARAVNARIRYEQLDEHESGFTVRKGEAFVITVNSSETPRRQRFTVCHEIAHIVLDLPSSHGELPSWSYAKRDPNELWCDVFASELLMPYELFERKISDAEPAVDVIEALAEEFGASFPATASRYASFVKLPCAYVVMDKAVVRYAAPNASLRRRGIRMSTRGPIPPGSLALRLRAAGEPSTTSEQVPQDVWFENCESGYELWELSRHYPTFDQTVSLLWCAEEDLPAGEVDRFNRRVEDEDDGGLQELTGELIWSKRTRKR